MHTRKVFISGNTRGNKDSVKARFDTVAGQLKNALTEVVLPTVLSEPLATWNESIRSDISALMSCDELHLLSNWMENRRSNILRDLAIRIGIKVTYHH